MQRQVHRSFLHDQVQANAMATYWVVHANVQMTNFRPAYQSSTRCFRNRCGLLPFRPDKCRDNDSLQLPSIGRRDCHFALMTPSPRACLAVSCRSVGATAFDQIYCMQLAQNAVHGSMAGYTAFTAGVVNNRTVRGLGWHNSRAPRNDCSALQESECRNSSSHGEFLHKTVQ